MGIYLDSVQPATTEQYSVGLSAGGGVVDGRGFCMIRAGSLSILILGLDGVCGTRMSLACAVFKTANRTVMMHQRISTTFQFLNLLAPAFQYASVITAILSFCW
jgi:hypothetical protein